MTRHVVRQWWVPVAAVFALAACESGGAGSETDGAGTAANAGNVVYKGWFTVLQDEDDAAPELCTSVMESYPPQCGGLPVSGWDWDSVVHEEASGVRWGDFSVTGAFDGTSLVLTEDPVPFEEADMAPVLEPDEPVFTEPAEDMSAAELQEAGDEVAAEFPEVVLAVRVDEGHGAAIVDTWLVTPELEAYVAERFPAGTVVFTSMLDRVA